MRKKTLGILGLGSNATLFYIQKLNALYHDLHKGYSTCPFLMLNANFDKINSLLPNVSTELDTVVQQYLDRLQHLEVECILIPNITLHETVDRLKMSKSILHPLQVCVEKLRENHHSEAILFGTKHTMSSTYISSYFKKSGIQLTTPELQDREFIETFRQKVYAKEENEEEIYNFHELLLKYATQLPVVIACTELSIHTLKHSNIFDMVHLQLAEAVKIVSENNS